MKRLILAVAAIACLSVACTEPEPGPAAVPTESDTAPGAGPDIPPTAASDSVNVEVTPATAAPTEPPSAPTQPPPPTATSEPQAFSFGDGTKLVGADIPPATYRTREPASFNCYWERLSGLGGTLGEILANANATGPAVVTVLPADVAFSSEGCPTWTQDLSALHADPAAPFDGNGTYFVGVDIAPGTWRSDATDTCYWARLTGFTGDLSEIIANGNDTGPIVTIDPSDAGFESSRCGTWTQIQ
jgi:hypothetical protein